MYKILFFLFISLLFTSCSSKNSAFKYFQKKDVETKGIQATQKIDILKDNEIDIILWATYLNKIDNKISNSKIEVFLVSLYFANSESQNIENSNYKFLLNGKESISTEKIEKDNENFKSLMLKNNWGNYYLVKFDLLENSSNSKLEFELTNQKSSRVILNFEK
jgi:PBP1b-binding outer membrane lipoprotein LpoB